MSFASKIQARWLRPAPCRSTVRRAGVAVGVALILVRLCCPFSLGVVEGRSMTPTYQPGQFFVLDRHYYRNHPIRRHDVVVVHCDDHTMIKRVFAVGGDSFWLLIENDSDRIDRYLVDPELLPRLKRCAARWDIGRLVRVRVPAGQIYLLGDCAEASIDSRTFGSVPTSAILGRVVPLRPGFHPAGGS